MSLTSFCVERVVIYMLKKLLREIERLEQAKSKQETIIATAQAEVAKIDEDLKKYNSIKKQYEKLEASANELLNK